MHLKRLAGKLLVCLVMVAGLAGPGGVAHAQKAGGTLVIGANGEPPQIVGFMHSDTVGYQVAANIFSGLIEMNANFEPAPDLARSWQVSPDGRTYTFQLHEKAKFHDGVPVTAQDAVFTFAEVVCKYHPSRGAWCPNVRAFEATGPHTFVIRLKEPFPPLLTLLAYQLRSGALILPRHVYQGTDPTKNPANDRPIGSGPFKFAEWVRGSHVRLVRNPDYFIPNRPFLDAVVVQVIADATARIFAFERGDVDFIDYTSVPHNELRRFSNDKRFEVLGGYDAVGVLGYWMLNHRNKPLDRVEVRQAMYLALNTDEITKVALFGAGRQPKSMLSSVIKGYYTPEYFTYQTNVARANRMLDDAGVRRGANGIRFAIECAWQAGLAYNSKSCEMIRDQLRTVGIDVKVQSYDRPTLIDRVFAKWQFDSIVQLITTGPDPALGVTTRFATNQINRAPFTNAMGYSNPELDALFEKDKVEVDPRRRLEYWRRAQAILMRDLPIIPIYELPDYHLQSRKFKDVVTGPFGYFQSRRDAYQVSR